MGLTKGALAGPDDSMFDPFQEYPHFLRGLHVAARLRNRETPLPRGGGCRRVARLQARLAQQLPRGRIIRI